MNTLAQQLTAARDSLTPDNWRKGAYFKFENGALCMCAHGAVQAQVNQVCAEAVRDNAVPATTTAVTATIAATTVAARTSTAGSARAAAVTAARAGAEAARTKSEPLSIWINRPAWVKEDYTHNNKNYGNHNAHYVMGMVGLTAAFNDAHSTTYEMVIAKFNEAIELAEQLCN